MKTGKIIQTSLLLLLFPLLFSLCRKTNTTLSGYELSVISLFPDSGNTNTLVTLKGKGYSLILTEDTVQFNGKNAQIKLITDTTIQVYAPAGGQTGEIGVSVRGIHVTGPVFTYMSVTPALLSISPDSANPLTVVNITGHRFSTDSTKDVVLFNSIRATIVSADSNQLRVQVPVPAAYPPGKIPVTVTVSGAASNTLQFQYLNYVPVISAISPTSGIAGTQVTIAGDHFLTDTSAMLVSFNGVKAAFVSAGTTKLVVTTPKSTTGTIAVKLVPYNVTATGPVFTYFSAPVITGIIPSSGQAGTQVTITGSNFVADTSKDAVYFNGVKAAVISASTTQIVVRAPAATTGNVSVTANGLSGSGPVFTYLSSPVITSISPASGQAGIQVTITGSNFVADTSKDAVYFNGVKATVISASTTQIVVRAPASTTGTVKVTANGLTGSGPVFTYPSAPAISGISPTAGQQGTQVTITGSNFIADTSKNSVYFNGVKAAVVSASATQIVVLAPNSTTGNVNVTANGLTGSGPVFSYVAVPVISNVTRGNFLAITGTNFDPTQSIVTIGGEVVSGFTYSTNGQTQTLALPVQSLPLDLGNPDLITVTVNNVVSNAYSFLFPPQILNAVLDTVASGQTVDLKGIFFGDQTASSAVTAFAYFGQNMVTLSPPTINSWTKNSIKLTMPNYNGTVLERYFPFYIQISVGPGISNVQMVYDQGQ